MTAPDEAQMQAAIDAIPPERRQEVTRRAEQIGPGVLSLMREIADDPRLGSDLIGEPASAFERLGVDPAGIPPEFQKSLVESLVNEAQSRQAEVSCWTCQYALFAAILTVVIGTTVVITALAAPEVVIAAIAAASAIGLVFATSGAILAIMITGYEAWQAAGIMCKDLGVC